MRRLLSYPWAFLYGFYFYLLFQIVYIVRFGHVNTVFSFSDTALYAVGLASVLLCQYLARELPRARGFMIIPFLVGLPFGFVGALGGGLLGWLGVFIFGFVPFAVALPTGYWVVKRVAAPPMRIM